ncbi:hypothetical protein [Aliivibrio fischeri]|uniref:hypothetical protein n=1 Tax=Aliivibrio fischeri TaxID=668 RepID=UPI0012DACADF|nr:hypothetical protein [Aliivibrio fischeri]MUJ26352.1 hypothetical protein [Aliivibrio fischeri]
MKMNIFRFCILVSSIIFVILSAKYAIDINDYSWFVRSGNVLAIVPLLLGLFDVLSDKKKQYMKDNAYTIIAPGNVEEKAKKYIPWVSMFYILSSFIGTLIAGYGDILLGKL